MKCALCGEVRQGRTVPFGAVCSKCDCWLHSCIQCGLWNSRSEMCRSATTDSVADRAGKNFCEEWIPGDKKTNPESDPDAGDRFSSLFGG